MRELPNLSQPKHTLLLRRVGPFLSTYSFNQIVSGRASRTITKAMALTFPRSTILKLSQMFCPTQPHLRTCHQQRTA